MSGICDAERGKSNLLIDIIEFCQIMTENTAQLAKRN